MWKVKVLIQFVLAHLPGGEQVNYLLQNHSPEKTAKRIPGLVEKLKLIGEYVELEGSTVLEHVPEIVIHGITIESKRILKQNGIAYHAVGLQDHYVGFDKRISKVNFLQYPEWLWAFFVKNKISYHNRLREKQFLEIFKSHGAKIKMISNKIDPSDIEVLKTMKIDKSFAGMTHEELAVYRSEIILSF